MYLTILVVSCKKRDSLTDADTPELHSARFFIFHSGIIGGFHLRKCSF